MTKVEKTKLTNLLKRKAETQKWFSQAYQWAISNGETTLQIYCAKRDFINMVKIMEELNK